MRIGDFVYFAPGIRFSELDLGSPDLGELLEKRIDGYYLAAARCCCDNGHAFAAGLILVACIDAVAGLQYPGPTGQRFRSFVATELAGFDAASAKDLYNDFRNGLVHEARIKNGGQYSLEQRGIVCKEVGLTVVNPSLLEREVQASLRRYAIVLAADGTARLNLARRLRETFAEELAGIHVSVDSAEAS